jgi:hypothetical protein
MIAKNIRFTPVNIEPVVLNSGLNENSSSMELRGGDIIDGYNYYIKEGTSGGYTSTAGYERNDGRPSPTGFSFFVLTVDLTEEVAPGDIVVGGGGTGEVAGISGDDMILIDVTGTFHTGNLYIAPLTEMLELTELLDELELLGTNVGTCYGPQLAALELTGSKRLEYASIVANYVRDTIEEVPGTGVVRGMHIYKGTLYAFRDKVGGLSAGMYKATTDGWEEIVTAGVT